MVRTGQLVNSLIDWPVLALYFIKHAAEPECLGSVFIFNNFWGREEKEGGNIRNYC